MTNSTELLYVISGEDFASAGEASTSFKNELKKLNVSPEVIRRASIAMYEGEINMVIHAYGGTARVTVDDKDIKIVLADNGPGIEDVEKAMQAGYSTATDGIRDLGFGAGMGLPNMKKYSDEMTIETHEGEGTTVTMIVHREPEVS
ncbi:MAG: ATP-binding protein [Lachnospiraceae bacterium]|nr:ATP-binding protein [Lachnospiraceae bacterium]